MDSEDDVNVFPSQSAVSVEMLRDTPPCARRKSISADYSNSLGARGGRGLRRSSIYTILPPLDLHFFAGSGPWSVAVEAARRLPQITFDLHPPHAWAWPLRGTQRREDEILYILRCGHTSYCVAVISYETSV
ncbi:hypothetical protein GWK47_014166 [Chionoecetes opilio]|uniref:Uncharacterized protein n=1 Tax=Chionoecetes opilio TaxID=41210 RepID=A0A8J4XTE0_CHIOP|nr:hypothetical protein GWK47_014166 [Chionoecetes opilio]